MNLRIVRQALWLVAAMVFGYAAFTFATARWSEFLITAGLFVICIPIDMALHHAIRNRPVSPFGPVTKWGLDDDAVRRDIKESHLTRWLRRLTHPMIIAASPVLIIPVGLWATPPAAADPFEDYAYITTLDQFGVPYASEGLAMVLGYAVCDALDTGMSIASVVRVGVESGYSVHESQTIVGAAIGAYCNEHYVTGGVAS